MQKENLPDFSFKSGNLQNSMKLLVPDPGYFVSGCPVLLIRKEVWLTDCSLNKDLGFGCGVLQLCEVWGFQYFWSRTLV